MKHLIILGLLVSEIFAENSQSAPAAEETISPLLSIGMIFFGLLTFVPYIVLTLREKKREKGSAKPE